MGTFIMSKCRYPAAPTLAPASPYVELLGGVLAPPLLRGPPAVPRSPRTCFSIQARRLPRQVCSESTIRGQGLHSAMSRAATATARPTCPGEGARQGDSRGQWGTAGGQQGDSRVRGPTEDTVRGEHNTRGSAGEERGTQARKETVGGTGERSCSEGGHKEKGGTRGDEAPGWENAREWGHWGEGQLSRACDSKAVVRESQEEETTRKRGTRGEMKHQDRRTPGNGGTGERGSSLELGTAKLRSCSEEGHRKRKPPGEGGHKGRWRHQEGRIPGRENARE